MFTEEELSVLRSALMNYRTILVVNDNLGHGTPASRHRCEVVDRLILWADEER